MSLADDGAMSGAIFDWDYVLWEIRLKLVAAGFFIYLGVFLLTHRLYSWISASYHTLSAKEKIFFNLDTARGLFGIQCSVAGLWALLIDPVFQADQVYSQQKWSWFHCLIATGFILLDNFVVYLSYIVFRTFNMLVIAHHLFAFGGLLGVVTNTKCGHYLALMGLLQEMSTPSGCIQSILIMIGWANTLICKADKWIYNHLQHCRMVLCYHMCWVYISNWNDMMENMGPPHFIVCFMGLSILTLIINPYWTYINTQKCYSQDFGSSEELNGETLQKKRI